MKNTLKKYFVFEGKVFGAGHLYILHIFDFSPALGPTKIIEKLKSKKKFGVHRPRPKI